MALHPSQIVYLRHDGITLYAEVIQLAIARPLCWVRPLALVETIDESQPDDMSSAQVNVYNLKEGSDLLWPTALFYPAVDTDVIPLIVDLETDKRTPNADAIATIKLRHFIQQVWEAHAPIFEAINPAHPTE
jgi:hypothetical protein